jgi:hypothetical protein
MNWSQRIRLARSLAACPVMDNPDRRALVVGQLPTGIRQSITDAKQTIDHILWIIDACLKGPRGLNPLTEIVRDMEQDSTRVRAVEDVLEDIRLSAVLEDRRDEVLGLIGALNLPGSTLRRLALDCLEVSPPPDSGGVGAVVDYLAALGQQGTRPFPRPVLEFIERVAGRDEASAARVPLRGIVAAVGAALGMSPADLEAARLWLVQAAPRPVRTLCVLVDFRPEKGPAGRRESANKDEARYFFDVWICEEDGKTFLADYPAAEARPLGAIRAGFFEHLYGLVNPWVDEGDKLRIELLLPRELRYEGFDQWARPIDPDARIGRRSQLVVRCRDRLSPEGRFGETRADWERHAKATLRKPLSAIKIIPFLREADATSNALFDAMVEVDGGFCLVVVATPSDFADPASHAELIQDAVDAGMAVGLWLRQRSVAVDDAADVLLKLLEAPSLDHLPQNVLKLRKSYAAKKDANDLANNLTLFWDDPLRVPPSLRLGAPRGRGIA